MTLRRDFLAFAAGAVTAKTVLPMAAKGEGHPDVALLAACTAFAKADAMVNHLNAVGDEDYSDDAMDAAVRVRYAALEAVSDLAPLTLGGLQAKARIAQDVLAYALKEDRAEPKGSREEFLALAVLRQMTGDAAAAMWA